MVFTLSAPETAKGPKSSPKVKANLRLAGIYFSPHSAKQERPKTNVCTLSLRIYLLLSVQVMSVFGIERQAMYYSMLIQGLPSNGTFE